MGKKRKKGSPITDAMASVLTETPAPLTAEAAAPTPAALLREEDLVEETTAPPPVVEPPNVSTEAPQASTQAPQVGGEHHTMSESEAEALIAATPTPIAEVVAVEPPRESVAPSTARPKRRKKRRTKPPPAAQVRDALDQKIDRLEAKLEVKKVEAAKAAREGFGSSPALDDQSVPPVDLEVHDEFFAAGEKGPVTRDASGAFSPIDARHAQKMTAAAHARRAHLARYVKWAVGGATALLLLGITVSKLRHPDNEPVRREIAHAAQVTTPPVQPEQAKPVDVPAVVELADQGNLDDKKVEDTKVDDKADEVKDDTDKKPDELPPEKPKNAWQEKQTAKAALERGANGVAVASGERSVALDASDGEAWLVLGAAYQAMGNVGQAKRCYNACISQGKKGPISDCKDVLGTL